MKARLLKKILNDTKRTTADYGKYIAAGSYLCHDLIRVEKETMKLSYALDTFHKGRESLIDKSDPNDLLFIWDKLQELIDSGELVEIIAGVDDIENPITIFIIKEDDVFETTTDALGWPNVTKEGILLHDNDHFLTEAEALEYGIRDYGHGVTMGDDRLKVLGEEIEKVNKWRSTYLKNCIKFTKRLKEIKES